MTLAKDLVLDVDFEKARAIHRVVRAMNDGECPSCHNLDRERIRIVSSGDLHCWFCGFRISPDEQKKEMQIFADVMEKNLEIFEEWRKSL